MIDDHSGEMIARAMIADSQLDDLKSYLDRGRAHRNLSDEQLSALFVSTFKSRLVDVRRGQQEHADAASEYVLRKVEPPYELIKAEVSEFTAKVQKLLENMTPEQRRQMLDRAAEDIAKLPKIGN